MSTVVCQGFQPCFDPQLVETTTLRLKVVEPKSASRTFPLLEDTNYNPKKVFLDEGREFFNPFPPLRLSDKSLELCTENLGSESGSDTSENSIFSLELESEKMSFSSYQRNLNSRPLKALKKKNPRDFPPPLTTIRGSNSLQVRPHREEGRLVMKAVHAPTSGSYFQAERSQGRLRLSIDKNFDHKFDKMENENENNKNVINVEIQEDENESIADEIYEDDDDDQEEYYEEEEDQCEGGESEENYYVREDWVGNKKDIGVEMGIKKFQRPSRCKEGGHNGDKGLCSWEAFWVATS